MSISLLHADPTHRRRQLRWVLLTTLGVAGVVAVCMCCFYYDADQQVSNEFWRAHKQISHTGQMLKHGLEMSVVLLVALSAGLAVWRFRETHRIVRAVHTIHLALQDMVAGNVGVRVQLRETDEFHEVAETLNRLVGEFRDVLTRLHPAVDDMVKAAEAGDIERVRVLAHDIDEAMDFFQVDAEKVIAD
jgi:methyl-accepting chemotaxis protein